mmetsp:Transcript_1617/g.4833  ORF Transcript_1617/g.4833 Transcript_1617/m.4833 type:complete len:261 (-) Transcript_1617:350-1132(-)
MAALDHDGLHREALVDFLHDVHIPAAEPVCLARLEQPVGVRLEVLGADVAEEVRRVVRLDALALQHEGDLLRLRAEGDGPELVGARLRVGKDLEAVPRLAPLREVREGLLVALEPPPEVNGERDDAALPPVLAPHHAVELHAHLGRALAHAQQTDHGHAKRRAHAQQGKRDEFLTPELALLVAAAQGREAREHVVPGSIRHFTVLLQNHHADGDSVDADGVGDGADGRVAVLGGATQAGAFQVRGQVRRDRLGPRVLDAA